MSDTKKKSEVSRIATLEKIVRIVELLLKNSESRVTTLEKTVELLLKNNQKLEKTVEILIADNADLRRTQLRVCTACHGGGDHGDCDSCAGTGWVYPQVDGYNGYTHK